MITRKMHLVGWDTITKPKDTGGLGIQKAKIRNQSLHAKLAWRIFNQPNSLWASYYYQNTPRLEDWITFKTIPKIEAVLGKTSPMVGRSV